MDYTLTDTQEQLKRAAGEVFEAENVIDTSRQFLDGDSTAIDGLWDTLAEFGYLGCTVPAEHGGLGDDMLIATLLHEEAGRVALPGPVPETVAFVSPLIDILGTEAQRDEYLPAIAAGNLRASVGLYESFDRTVPEDFRLSAEQIGGGYRLSGTKTSVPFADTVDLLLVAARAQPGSNADGISLFLVDPTDLAIEPIDSLDRTRPIYSVTFDGHHVPKSARLGPLDGCGDQLCRAVNRYRIAICGMMVGAASRVVDSSIEHVSTREQFGKPIGRFQAVKHRVVDMWMDVEAATSLVYYAAAATARDRDDAPRSVSAAKAFCSDRFIELCQADIQNHGAMGFTWDHDTHIFLKQFTAWENYLGSVEDHRNRIADARLL